MHCTLPVSGRDKGRQLELHQALMRLKFCIDIETSAKAGCSKSKHVDVDSARAVVASVWD